jgi:2-desacetyl-2-hydroxyethyl bacteriochlorophyllide A dehydrogenase
MENGMNRTVVVMAAARRIEILREALPEPGPAEVTVRTEASAISAGTELLLYRGEGPAGMELDAARPSLAGSIGFPLRYGYAAVGEVTAAGEKAPAALRGRRVFCFHPHASLLNSDYREAIPVPADIPGRDALFLAAMETAITLVLDGGPLIGERSVVFGQGMVGLLVTALLARTPLRELVAVEPSARRRQAALEAGAHAALAPDDIEGLAARWTVDPRSEGELADLVFELSGDPQALQRAIGVAGFGGRVVIGSWYGTKPCRLDLGGRFHRSRIRLVASQVSTLPPGLEARWTRERRLALAWEMIRRTAPSRWISHEFAMEEAAKAYALLDGGTEEVLQVILSYR